MKATVFTFLFAFPFFCSAQSETYAFVFLHKKPNALQMPKEQLDKIMQGHMSNIERLAQEGKLLAAGPFEGGGGIFILNTNSTDEANLWLSTDPGIQAKRWDIEILSYQPRIGSVCSAKEPYEMVMYHFIRFTVISNSQLENVEILKLHDEYVKRLATAGSIITEAALLPAGSILILKSDLKKEIVESDPAVKQGIFSIDSKALWIAKGSFCEK